MTTTPEHAADLEQLKRALVAVRKLRARVDELEQAAREPIAIVGIGCRVPGGANSPAAFWQLLREGRDVIREVPADRWNNDAYWSADPDAPGTIPTRFGGFLDDVQHFDADFFGVSPREAAVMDPQQRLVLETAWEALEDAGIVPATLAGSATGVFVGIGLDDFARLQAPGQAADPTLINSYTTSGNVLCIVANRLSYTLDLRGPSMAIDTACSSSLVAIHQACRSLRNGDCGLALVGGSNLLLAPDNFVSLSKFLAADGRCKFGDARADGFVRAEGVIMMVLAPLRRALADNLPIYALIRGAAVNQDGYSSGLTVPNGVAQQAMLRAALADAGVEPHAVRYVEAHGTGTALGDPIELQALGAVLGAGRDPAHPLLVGSVKSNIGHLEAGAGIAGVAKVALALKHGEIPPSLHFEQPNPHIPFEQLRLRVATSVTPWPSGDGPRIAGVSSFGFGGTNAHVILEEAPAAKPANAAQTDAAERPLHLLPLAAKTLPGLRTLAGRYAALLAEQPEMPIADLCAAAGRSRSHFAERAAFVAPSTADLRAQLEQFAAGDLAQGVQAGRAPRAKTPKVAFLFTGQGAQYAGMGRGLYEHEPVFRVALDRCADLLRPHLEHDLREVLYGSGPQTALLDQTGYTQPALFALEYALAAQWQAWGVAPGAVVGHSVGEYVAAVVAGVLGLEEGLRLIAARGRLMQSLPAGGAMAALFAAPEWVADALRPYGGRVAVAAVNEPGQVVISGDVDAVDALCAACAAEGHKTRRLVTSHAFHSPRMEPILDEFERVAAGIAFRPPRIPLASNLTGDLWPRSQAPDAHYWRRHLREPVQFARNVEALHAAGCDLFLEIGPAPVLVAAGSRSLPDVQALWLPSLRSGADDWQTMLKSLGALYAAGVNPEWAGVDGGRARSRVALPTYPFQRERHWFRTPDAPAPRPAAPRPAAPRSAAPRPIGALHPLLDRRLRSPALAGPVYELDLSLERWPLLDGHRIFGVPLFPGTAYVEQVLAAAADAYGPGRSIAELLVRQPLAVADGAARTVQLLFRDVGTEQHFEVISRDAGPGAGEGAEQGAWQTHASGRLAPAPLPGPARDGALAAAQAACPDAVDVDRLYAAFAERGVGYGPAFRGVVRAWRGARAALAQVRLPHDAAGEASRYAIHPALLDACLQISAALLPLDLPPDLPPALPPGAEALYLPFSVEDFHLHAAPGTELWSALEWIDGAPGAETMVCRLRLFDGSGNLVGEAGRVVLKQARRAAFAPGSARGQAAPSGWLYGVSWQPQPLAAATVQEPGRWLVVDGAHGLGARLAAALEAAGAVCTVLTPGADAPGPESLRAQVEALAAADAPLRGAVFLSGDSLGGADPAAEQERILGGALHLAQALAATGGNAARLWLATVGAQAVGDFEATSPAHATLWGFGRVAAREHPELGCVCIDLDPADPIGSIPLLAAELLAAPPPDAAPPDAAPPDGSEDQVALRSGARLVARLAPLPPPDAAPVKLEVVQPGTFDQLALRPVVQPEPGPGEVLIRVHAAGLNFRDVLIALGVYPGGAERLGNECAGTVLAVGADVHGPAVGDAVLAIAYDSIGTFAVARAAHTLPIPAGLSFAQAATIPIAFATAAYALRTLAGIQAGDRVLIHAAAGGVGLAAVQIAQRAGAVVIGTAGSPEKRAYLHALGVEHVFDSRSLSFVDGVRAATGGAGVDIVLNSLAGDFIPAGLGLLREGGCFLEIGKRDIWEPAQVAALGRNIAYHVIYLGELCAREPEQVRTLLADVVAELAAGALRPLPLKLFPLGAAADAFRWMAQARHIGKVVLAPPVPPPFARADGTYLITGGLGGIGLVMARGLVDAGARQLVLMGRSAPSPAAEAAVAELGAAGARLLVVQADAADEDALRALLARIDAELPPLRGVVHAAGVLDDGPLMQQNWARAAGVLAPKVAGAWALHRLTAGRALDWMLYCSAGATLLGLPGQAPYAAANAFLDSLAHLRRARGLPALSVNWGLWGEVGMGAALDARARQRFADSGLLPIAPADGLRALVAALGADAAQVAALPVEWDRFGRQFAGRALPSLFRTLAGRVPAAGSAPGAASVDDLATRLARTAPGNRRSFVRGVVREHVGRVLELAPGRAVDPRQPLGELGLDSLMAVELRNSLGAAAGRSLPTTLLFDHPTIEALVDFLMVQLAPPSPAPSPEPEASNGARRAGGDAHLAADLAALSDEEAEALLLDELSRPTEAR